MAYIYQADVWCDACGQEICDELTKEGKAPADPDDPSTYDSDEYPKDYDAKWEESDGPDNCASGECGGSYEYEGRKITYGTFLENQLTPEGYKYLKSMLDKEGPTLRAPLQEWADFYDFHYLSTEDIAEDEDETREPGWYSPEMSE